LKTAYPFCGVIYKYHHDLLVNNLTFNLSLTFAWLVDHQRSSGVLISATAHDSKPPYHGNTIDAFAHAALVAEKKKDY
jgi:hypothetical protein